MFLQYGVPGAMWPLFSLRLQALDFTPMQMALACASQALGSLTSPLLIGQVADRWYPAQRCLGLCALGAAVVLWVLADLNDPVLVFLATLGFWMLMSPAIVLGTTMCFVHLPASARDFGAVRLWGTIGWVAAAWTVGYWWSEPRWIGWLLALFHASKPPARLEDIFRISGILALVLAVYSLTLPHTPPRRVGRGILAPVAALRALRSRSFIAYWIGVFGVSATYPFTTQITPLLLAYLGMPNQWIGPTLTLGQSMEVTSLAVLPMLLLRLDFRQTMLLGLGAWALDLGLLTLGEPIAVVCAALMLNGLCICCYLVAGQVYVNAHCRDDIRASSQALVTCVTGLGMLAGNLLVGWVRKITGEDYRRTFAVGAIIATALVVVFLVGFREDGEG
jgi:MFS family permease